MNTGWKVGSFGLVICLLLLTGCATEADKAAQGVLDALEELERRDASDVTEFQRNMELMMEFNQQIQILADEVNKMSPDEREEFLAKWQKKFEAKGFEYRRDFNWFR